MPSMNGNGSKSETARVALYLRVSSEEQRERQTIQTQREFLSEYARVMGLEVVDNYLDDGVLGTIPLEERSEGKRLLEDARAGKFDTVLVYKLDRLGRTLLVIVEAHDKLAEFGVGLRSPHEAIDTPRRLTEDSRFRHSPPWPSSSARISARGPVTDSTGPSGQGSTWA